MRDGAIGIVFNEQKTSVLIIKRCDVPIWVLPGGGIEIGESPEEAVIRELYEETGLRVKILRKVGEYFPRNQLASTSHVFECEPLTEELTLSDESADIGFYPVNRLPNFFFPIHQDLREESQLIQKPISGLTYFNILKHCFLHPILVIRYLLSRFGCPINTKSSQKNKKKCCKKDQNPTLS